MSRKTLRNKRPAKGQAQETQNKESRFPPSNLLVEIARIIELAAHPKIPLVAIVAIIREIVKHANERKKQGDLEVSEINVNLLREAVQTIEQASHPSLPVNHVVAVLNATHTFLTDLQADDPPKKET